MELPVIHPRMATFASAVAPLRPSEVAKFLACPMAVVLESEDRDKPAADIGSLVHAAAHVFHTESTGDRVAAGLKALDAAREKFPAGDPAQAREIFRRYSADPANEKARVVYSELPVTMNLPPDRADPTGERVVISGTLDQIRDEGGTLSVWDIKTGTYHKPYDEMLNNLIQQGIYVLAARQTLGLDVRIGGIIKTNSYFSSRSQVFVPNELTLEQVADMMCLVPPYVAAIRRGEKLFNPSVDHCRFCDHRPWPKCHSKAKACYAT